MKENFWGCGDLRNGYQERVCEGKGGGGEVLIEKGWRFQGLGGKKYFAAGKRGMECCINGSFGKKRKKEESLA